MATKELQLVVPITHFSRVTPTVYVRVDAAVQRGGHTLTASEAKSVDAIGLLARPGGLGGEPSVEFWATKPRTAGPPLAEQTNAKGGLTFDARRFQALCRRH